MKPAFYQQVEFIKDCLRKGDTRKIILGKFGTKWVKASKNTFARRLKLASEAIGSEQSLIQKEAEKGVAKKIDELESKIMTAVERKIWLTKMVSGEIKAKKPFVIAGKIMEYQEDPNHSDRVRALAELNKMDGDYAPVKQDINITGTKISVKLNK